jgi:hypothetical protein
LHRRRRTALLLSAALVAAGPALTACGSDARSGAAAVVGRQQITVTQLENRVNEVRAAQRSATADGTQYEQVVAQSGGLTRDTLHNMVLDEVLNRAARDAGVKVTRKEVQAFRSSLEQQVGGAKALETAWLQRYGAAPQHLDDSLRTEIEARKLGTVLGADMNTEPGRNIFWKALSEASRKLAVDLNPRYGTWNVETSARVDAKTPWLREITPAAQPRTA